MTFKSGLLGILLACGADCASLNNFKLKGADTMEYSRVIRVKPETYRREVLEEKIPVLLYVHIKDCQPCDELYKNLVSIQPEYDGNVKFCRIDLEDLGVRTFMKEHLWKESIILKSYPTILFYHEGRISYHRPYGYSKREDLKNDIDRILLRLYEH